MVYLLENGDGPRCTLEASVKEQFTQKLFTELIQHTHTKCIDYYIGRVQIKTENSTTYYCYDAKQLCKYIFEMVISTEGRKIRVKNFKDPISQNEISDVHFFRLKYDSDVPLRAEYIGNQDDFLESNSLRSKIFYSEDAFDALSVNFQFNSTKKSALVDKKRMMTLFLMFVMGLICVTSLIVLIERKHPNENNMKTKNLKAHLFLSHK